MKQAKEAYVVVTTDTEVKVDDLIDNTIVVGIYDESNYLRLVSCIPLSLHTMEGPIHKNEPVHKPDFLESRCESSGI